MPQPPAGDEAEWMRVTRTEVASQPRKEPLCLVPPARPMDTLNLNIALAKQWGYGSSSALPHGVSTTKSGCIGTQKSRSESHCHPSAKAPARNGTQHHSSGTSLQQTGSQGAGRAVT